MRVLVISDLAQTGFGRVGREIASGLLAKGHELRIIGINWRGYEGEMIAAAGDGTPAEKHARVMARSAELVADPLTSLTVAAGAGGDGMGHRLTAPALRGALWTAWKPEAVIVVADPRAMWLRLAQDEGSFSDARKAGVPIYNYVPIEGGGLPEDWRAIYRHVEPVAMCAFGQEQLQSLLGRSVPLAYHGVSDAFRPITPQDPGSFKGRSIQGRDAAKEAFGLRGKTVVLRTDRYIFRKNYPAFFRVMAPLLAADPNLMAVVHTVPYDDDGRGTIWQLISRLPGATVTGMSKTNDAIWSHPQVMLTGAHDSFRGLSDGELNVLYQAADVMFSPTMAEGFGLCLAEAMAGGTPIVATDYSAVSEVVGEGGSLVPVHALITNAYAHEWALIDEDKATSALSRLLSKPALRRELGAAGRRHVAGYRWSAAVDVFDGLITGTAAIAA